MLSQFKVFKFRMNLGRQIAQDPLLRMRQLGSTRGTTGLGYSFGTTGTWV